MQGSRIMSFKIYDQNRHKWEFRDSFSLLPRSLNYLCESFKPDHIKLERPQTEFNDSTRNEWIRYCRNDCLSLYEILQKFNNTINDIRGCVGYTIASTALKTFRKRFLDQELSTYHQFNQFFRKAYYGGRTEIFNMHAPDNGKTYYYYDVNSMYPYVMQKYKYPISRPQKMNYHNIEEINGKCGIMDVTVTAPPDLHIPLLPYHREDGKLLFPLGKWRAVYEYSLIEKAIKYGYHIKIHNAYEFDSDYLFKDYVEHFYSLKTQAEGAEKEIYKLLLNSLYGKWGELPKRKRLITDPDKSLEGTLPYDTHFGYAIQEYIQNSAHHLPATSIRVTAKAQILLYDFMEKIQRHGGTIYYCDTDSIITDIRIDTSKKLGDIDLELEFQEGIFLLPKTYILKTYDKDDRYRIKTKGFTQQIKQHLGDMNIWKKALTDQDYSPFTEQRIRPASLNEIRIRHLKGFVTLLQQRSIKTTYDKRTINDDFTTKPLII